jgi:hypothetical protein
MSPHDAAEIARAYHERWTTRDFAGAAALLADTLVVEVPVNRYPTAEAFAAALASFGSTVTRVDLLAAMSTGHEAMVLYDLDAEALGTLRVAEHFDAVGTVDGPRHWWTTIVTGSAMAGGQLRFGFAGLDEQIVMHVDVARPPAAVSWSCMAHTRDEEWTGTTLRFELTERGPEACELDFRHSGISPELVAGGWDHFLASLAAYAEHGLGTPYGA